MNPTIEVKSSTKAKRNQRNKTREERTSNILVLAMCIAVWSASVVMTYFQYN